MMIHRGLNLPTFLFNPPHASLAPAIGKHVRQDVYAVGYFLKYALMSKVIPSSHKNHMEEVFEKLRTWDAGRRVQGLHPLLRAAGAPPPRGRIGYPNVVAGYVPRQAE